MAELEIFEVPEIIPIVMGVPGCYNGDCYPGQTECDTGTCTTGGS